MSRVESELNIQFTQFNLSSERPTEKVLVSKKRGGDHGGQKQAWASSENLQSEKKRKRSGLTERRATGVSIERRGEVEGARTPLSAAMGGQYVNERLPRR